MNGNRYTENKSRKNGFYLALAVCLVAVGIAAWSTYDAVQSYKTENPVSSQVSDASSAHRDDPELPHTSSNYTHTTSSKPSGTTSSTVSRPSVTSKAPTTDNGTASKTESRVESRLENDRTAAEDAEDERPQVPVNAPMYEISSQMIYPVDDGGAQKAYSAGAPVYSATMKDWRVHTGLDLNAESGADVRACANGRVLKTYSDSMMGNVILIEHGDYEFSYCGVSENFLVKEGDIVTKGQVIGTVTAVPMEAADKPHLHLEARRDSVNMDPEEIIEGKN